MKTYTKTTITEEPRLKITPDENAESPRAWDCNLGYFITQDKNYNSPDIEQNIQVVIKDTGEIAKNQAEHIKLIKYAIEKGGEKVLAIYPVVKYEHSGVIYSLGSIYDFDYSNNGFYIITEKTQKNNGAEKKNFEEVIKAELDIYNKYINGEVYRFIFYNENGEIVDSCGEFYDIEDIKEYLPKEWKGEDLNEYIIC